MPNITLSLTNVTSSSPSPITATAGTTVNFTLSANSGYYLPAFITFGSGIVTKSYNQSTGQVSLVMPSANTTITAVAVTNLEKALIGKGTYVEQTNGIINAIGGIPSSLPNRFVQYAEVDGNKIYFHNYGAVTPLQTFTMQGLPEPIANCYLKTDSEGNISWSAGTGGGTVVVANPTLIGTESSLDGIQIDTAKYSLPYAKLANLVTTFDETSTDEQFPSAKAVWDTKIPASSISDNLTPNYGLQQTTPIGSLRSTAGNASIGKHSAQIDKLQGVSIAWNQLCNNTGSTETINGVTFTKGATGIWTVNGTATADISKSISATFIAQNHKFLLKGCPVDGSDTTYYMKDANVDASIDTGSGVVFTYPYTFNSGINIVIKNGTSISNLVFKPRLIDLTLMFGNNDRIPDELLNGKTENSTFISAPTCFERMFRDYPLTYNAGTLISCKPTDYKMVGYNAFDGVWEYNEVHDYVIQSKFIPVIPNQKYTIRYWSELEGLGTPTGFYFAQYDKDQNLIKTNSSPTIALFDVEEGTKVTESNTFYIRLQVNYTANVPLPTNDVGSCLHLTWSGSKTGYEEHQAKSYTLGGEELKGLYGVSGDEKTPNGKITRKYGIVDLGTLTWEYKSSGFMISQNLPSSATTSQGLTGIPNALCPKYEMDNWNNAKTINKKISVNGLEVTIRDEDYTDAIAFKTAMSGVYLIYELATPTTEQGTAYSEFVLADDYGTQEITSNTSVAVPTGNKIYYSIDLKSFLQKTFINMDGDADRVESTYNRVTTISDSSTNLQYPTAKAVHDYATKLYKHTISFESSSFELVTNESSQYTSSSSLQLVIQSSKFISGVWASGSQMAVGSKLVMFTNTQEPVVAGEDKHYLVFVSSSNGQISGFEYDFNGKTISDIVAEL